MNTIKKSNSLIFKTSKTIGKTRIDVSIRLDDQCKNGHQDFSITCSGYELSSNNRLVESFGGCAHQEILKFYPQFKIFVDLHLCDYLGNPMHASANMFYHIKREEQNKFLSYYNCVTESDYKKLFICEDELHFKYVLFELGVPNKWQELAKKGIEELEKLTNTEFLVDSVKTNLTPLTEEQSNLIASRLNSGYYLPENIEKRRLEALQAKKDKLTEDVKRAFNKKHEEMKQDLEIDLVLIKLFATKDNVIFYKHTNTIVVNWQNSTYNKMYNETEFKRFKAAIKAKRMFEGTKIEFKTY